MEYGARLNSSCSTSRETNNETHVYLAEEETHLFFINFGLLDGFWVCQSVRHDNIDNTDVSA